MRAGRTCRNHEMAGKSAGDRPVPRCAAPGSVVRRGARRVGFNGDSAACVACRMDAQHPGRFIASTSAAAPAGGEAVSTKGNPFRAETFDGLESLTRYRWDLACALVSDLKEPGRNSCMVRHQGVREREFIDGPAFVGAAPAAVAGPSMVSVRTWSRAPDSSPDRCRARPASSGGLRSMGHASRCARHRRLDSAGSGNETDARRRPSGNEAPVDARRVRGWHGARKRRVWPGFRLRRHRGDSIPSRSVK